MEFLCDVHISFQIVKHLQFLGYKAFHVNDLVDKWYTKDAAICNYADENNLIVVTKDSDFRNSFLVSNSPRKLIKVNLGNVSNTALKNMISTNIEAIKSLDLQGGFMIELDPDQTKFIIKD